MDTLKLGAGQRAALPAPREKMVKKWAPLFVLSLALAIIILDTTILNVTLRTIINDLGTTINKIQWVITTYSLILAAFTITGGRLGDLFGRKKMFVLGAIIFAIGSFITSISQNVGTMIAGEAVIEGLGAALMMPATVSLLRSCYSGRDLALAFGIWGGIASAAAALGPLIGGWLSTNYSWRWAFRVNIAVVIILVIASFVLHEARDESHKPTIDYFGIVLSSLGLLSLVFGFIESSTYGWWKAAEPFSIFGGKALDLAGLSPTPFFILLGLALMGFFVIWERRVERGATMPLVSLKIFKNRQFVGAAVVTGLLSLSMAGLTFAIPVYLQAVLGLDPFHTGLALFPMTIVILLAAPLSAWLGKHVYPKRIVQLGIMLNMLGFFVLLESMHVGTTQWDLAPGFMLFGFGMGLIMGQTNNLALSAVPAREAGEAAGVNNTFRQVGSSLGAAIIGSILISGITANMVAGINANPTVPADVKPLVTSEIEHNASEIEFGGPAAASSGQGGFAAEVSSLVQSATVEADRTSFAWGIFFGLISLLLSGLIPRRTVAAGELAPES